ncbi:IS110 family transposase [Aliivibrio finisterrensis]|uniref:IS110 family transposase n=1 Tax=Aliivibrio finisterrensis TaxID=511998 RepID=A0A6N6RNN6_9GAMM|nr:IS110 family transposase [Aliivibrio finisterrensis]KAB2823006.1 IS110 family transposase [Aliivibrio finisterrensis]
MTNHNVLAIDLAKNVFQVCKFSRETNKVIYNKELSRKKLKELLIREKISLVAMEACASAHYWARYAKEHGHEVKVINARAVKGFLVKQKTDKNDAHAIAIAATMVHIKSVGILTPEEQGLQSLERARELAKAHRTALSNQIRGLLSEFGIVFAKGFASLNKELPFLLEDAENNLPYNFRQTLHQLWEMFHCYDENLKVLEKQVEQEVKQHSMCKKLMKLEGVGPIAALGLSIRLGAADTYNNGREAAANMGLTPKQHSSGGKENIGHISKNSADKRLRSVLFQGALSVINSIENRPAKTNKELWLKALIIRRGKKVAAIAFANKTVRTAYALIKNKTEYAPVELIA